MVAREVDPSDSVPCDGESSARFEAIHSLDLRSSGSQQWAPTRVSPGNMTENHTRCSDDPTESGIPGWT